MSGTISLADAKAHARGVMERSGTSFGMGMKILSAERRDAMFAIYAYCREIDDIADEGGTQAEKIAGLNTWREEIDRIYDGAPSLPTGVAVADAVQRYDLPKDEFILLIEGMEMDASGPVVAPDFDTLYAYTRRVAGAVGMLSMPIFGAPRGEASDRFALALADALQLTNILRDVAEDADIGRLYLPRELLERHSVPTDDPMAAAKSPEIRAVCAELSDVAKKNFEEARLALKDLDWRVLRPALLMMGMYETYLARLRAGGWRDIGAPVRLSKFEKIIIATRYALAPPLNA